MDKFNVKADIYSREISVKSKKYAELAWQKGIEIAQVKFAEVLTKGPSALFDFRNISFNIGNSQTNNGVTIKEITDDEESFSNDDYSENNNGQKEKEGDEIKSNQMILKKKRSSPSNSNIKKFSIESKHSNTIIDESKDIKKKKSANKMSNEIDNSKKSKDTKKKRSVNKISNEVDGNKKTKDIRKKRTVNKMNNEFDANNEVNYHSPHVKRNDMNEKASSNSPYSQPYTMDYNIIDDKDFKKNKKKNNDENNDNSTKFGKESNSRLFMNMMSNQRPGPGGMMGISDVYSSESDDLPSNNSNSNDEGNYYENEVIEENYNYNKNNLTFGENSQRKNFNRINQRTMKDNYYDYDIDLIQDDDTVNDNDIQNEANNYSIHQRRRVRSNIIDNREQPGLNYQQSYLTNFNSFLH